MINVSVVKGNLGSDADIHYFGDGQTGVASFAVAVTEKFKDSQDQQQERTHWIPCKIYGSAGRMTFASQYLKKGQNVVVTGRLEMERWPDRTNPQKENTRLVVRVDTRGGNLELCGSRKAGGDQAGNPAAGAVPAPGPNASGTFNPADWDDAEPF